MYFILPRSARYWQGFALQSARSAAHCSGHHYIFYDKKKNLLNVCVCSVSRIRGILDSNFLISTATTNSFTAPLQENHHKTPKSLSSKTEHPSTRNLRFLILKHSRHHFWNLDTTSSNIGCCRGLKHCQHSGPTFLIYKSRILYLKYT